MAEVKNTGYLSIGEVLGLLLEDFPDVTISKIRFLESQGLISPERTSSGYRKFYDADVELLRVILTEQRSNYLPLRVIKDRLETGEIDPTGEHLRPDDEESDPTGDPPESQEELAAPPFEATVPTSSISAHPASGGNPAHPSSGGNPDREAARQAAASNGGSEPAADQMSVLSGLLIDGTELCALVGMDDAELEHLESFGIIAARDGSTPALYDEDAVQIAKPACELLRAGVDARHLRNWRTSAEREASLYEQLVTPRFRQRNPASRAEALEQLRRLDVLGGDLRAAMTRHALRRHFEST